ncbi:hypothetical protein AVEN_167105-1 [Araneus ventricosus]|uniref:Uncharacterized protein n=1 Tax=Araneus ventricosus TaxID=182803 RepID=A0A4Y2P380_ARAVE|nr:hypothetical protein AVEN_167105-1 [Araneus ventricosus]
MPLDFDGWSQVCRRTYTGCSGFMHIAAGKRCYEKSAVILLPFVNLEPPIPTSINTCLRFAAEECSKRQQRLEKEIRVEVMGKRVQFKVVRVHHFVPLVFKSYALSFANEREPY